MVPDPSPPPPPQGPRLDAATELAGLERQVNALLSERRYAEAEALVRPRVASGSAPVPVWRLLARTLRPQGRIAETRTIQEMLVEAVPGDLSGRFDLAETLLLLGEFERGWREYRWRYSLSHTAAIERKVQRPRWDGRRIEGRTLLIHDEQGFGDTLQFMRMIPWARERSGARLLLEVHPALRPLIERAGGFDGIAVRGELPEPFDVHCELMSLPMVLGLALADLPGPVPYASASPGHLAKWRRRLAGLPRPLVALAWAGRPEHPNDRNRSLALGELAALARPDVTYLAVQKGPRAVEATAPPAGMSLLPLDSEIRDFEDTAAILAIADLLISVDSSPLHLAGALGRPAWALLPFVPDWRWLLERGDTPWYPSLRLFRQPAPGDWNAPLAEAAQSLATLVGAR